MRTHSLPSALGQETFTAVGAAWVPQEWLFSVAAAAAAQHNLSFALTFAMSAVPLAILSLVYLRARGTASLEAIGIALLFCGMAFLESFGVRAQVLGWLMLALFMYFLERRDRWYYAAIPTTVLWANLHASAALAPVLVLARLAAVFFNGGFRALRTSRDLAMLPATILALFCTPLGWRLPIFAVTLAHSPIRRFIQEWQPVAFHDLSFTFGALPLALLAIVGGLAFLRREAVQAVPAAVLFAALLFASRNIALFAIVAGPLAARTLDARFPKVRNLNGRIRELAPAALVAFAVAFSLSAFALLADERAQPPRLPIAAMATLAADRQDHRLFCQDFTWCSLALQYPNVRVFIDGRCDAYPVPVWKRYIGAITLREPPHSTLRDDAVDAIIARLGSPFAVALAKEPNWRQTFQDRSFVVFRHD